MAKNGSVDLLLLIVGATQDCVHKLITIFLWHSLSEVIKTSIDLQLVLIYRIHLSDVVSNLRLDLGLRGKLELIQSILSEGHELLDVDGLGLDLSGVSLTRFSLLFGAFILLFDHIGISSITVHLSEQFFGRLLEVLRLLSMNEMQTT